VKTMIMEGSTEKGTKANALLHCNRWIETRIGPPREGGRARLLSYLLSQSFGNSINSSAPAEGRSYGAVQVVCLPIAKVCFRLCPTLPERTKCAAKAGD
jgi:hypothetical protein